MSDIRFYHLTRKTLEQALPELLEKTISRNWRAVVMTSSETRAEDLTQHLWSYHQDRFLPHGNQKDGHEKDQPIWLTDKDENPNEATVLFLTDSATSKHISDYDIVCEIFNGRDEVALNAARSRWKEYKEAGHTLSYWQQTAQGWEKKQG